MDTFVQSNAAKGKVGNYKNFMVSADANNVCAGIADTPAYKKFIDINDDFIRCLSSFNGLIEKDSNAAVDTFESIEEEETKRSNNLG